MAKAMPLLTGFLNPSFTPPSFLIPLFAERPRSNSALVQVISAIDIVTSFAEIDASVTQAFEGEHTELCAGQKAIWAFQFAGGAIQYGSSAVLSFLLTPYLKEHA